MPTIASTLRSTARRIPDTVALKFENRHYDYAELDATVDRTANALAELGLTRGDRFALMAGNSDRFVVTFYAALRLGAIFVPVNPASAPPELRYLLEDSSAKVLAFDPALAGTVDAMREKGLPRAVEHLVALGESAGAKNLLALSAVASAAEPPDSVDEFDDALILYTSGTTGTPKGALFDHHRTLWAGNVCIGICGMRVADRFLHVAPLYHAAELCIMLVPGVLLGATHVIHPGFDPIAVADALESERITMFFGVPTMIQALLQVPGLPDRDLSAWRTGLFGAAPMPASAVARLSVELPQVDFVQLCGQTEAGPGGIYCDADQVRARPDASGRQTGPCTVARVVGADGEQVGPGEVGELVLRGESIMKGYWGKPAETAEAFRGGWLHTGDLARLYADGYMTLVDRLKDMIITGGRNVYSVEVENALAAHPHIADVAVIARPHQHYGESIVAVVTPHEGESVTLEEVKRFCRERISDYKIPHDLVLGTIPRNASGKISKPELRASLRYRDEPAVAR